MHEVERGMHLARHGVRTGLAWEVVGIAHRAMGGGQVLQFSTHTGCY